MTKSESIQVNRLQRGSSSLAYDVRGEGPLVVCIPGMGDLRSTFRHLAPALAQAGYRVATFDLRGHGDSDVAFDSYDDLAAGSDALALVEQLGGPAVLVGSSMGAGAAAWAAAERPDLIAGLVLSGPFVRNPPTGAVKGLLLKAGMAAMLTGPWKLAALKTYLRSLYPTGKTPDVEQQLAAMLAGVARPGRWAPFRATTKTSHAPVEARLGEVRAPAVVVMGTKDPDFADPAAEARWVGERLGAPVVLVDGAGHYPHSEFPEQVVPATLELLARAFPRG